LNASRNTGAVVTVSALALIEENPTLESLAEWEPIPTAEREFTFTCLSIQANNRVEGLGRNVVIGRQFKPCWQLANLEGIGNLLLVGIPFVTATPYSSSNNSSMRTAAARQLACCSLLSWVRTSFASLDAPSVFRHFDRIAMSSSSR
jgi:hypothetical protein